tara:strand:+ start:1702 stop:2601 length:900 start_codon:yes stop_codon:yes gene_type:complete
MNTNRLNKNPIILNCFSRGGSNILWNYFLSHPNICHPIEETLQIFCTSLKAPRVEGYKVAFMEKRFLFNQWNFNDRSIVKSKTAKYIDRVLYRKKINNIFDNDMKYKSENEVYSKTEIKNTRLVLKNNNGIIYSTNLFREIYPDATFIGLIRHPVALYESHKRRKTPVAESTKKFADFYANMVKKMLIDKKSIPNYHMIKFEELLSDPIESLKRLYAWANLDFSAIKKIRLKAKPFINKYGYHLTSLKENKHYWFTMGELDQYLDKNVNKNQISNVNQTEKESIIKLINKDLSELGYDV